MKTKEVIKELEKMNMITEIRENVLFVYTPNGLPFANISLDRKFGINTRSQVFRDLLSEDEQEKVYVLLTKLAETDPNDREEEKRYYLKHKWLYSRDCNYLNFKSDENSYMLSYSYDWYGHKKQFTKAEIDKIKEKFNTNLEDFEIIEVEE